MNFRICDLTQVRYDRDSSGWLPEIPMITLHSVVVATKDQISTEIGDEAVILNLGDGGYYGLNPLGVFVWKPTPGPPAPHAPSENILPPYNTSPQTSAHPLPSPF